MIRALFLSLLLFLSSKPIIEQSPVQTIRGTIIDQDTQLPLVGATIQILITDTTLHENLFIINNRWN